MEIKIIRKILKWYANWMWFIIYWITSTDKAGKPSIIHTLYSNLYRLWLRLVSIHQSVAPQSQWKSIISSGVLIEWINNYIFVKILNTKWIKFFTIMCTKGLAPFCKYNSSAAHLDLIRLDDYFEIKNKFNGNRL